MPVEHWQHRTAPILADSLGARSPSAIGEKLHEVALRHPERPAVITAEGTLRYRDLDERTDRIAAGLRAHGLAPGDTVLVQVGNSLETLLAWYGIIKSGAIPVATLLMHRAHEIGQIGDIVEARAHLVDASYRKFDLIDFARRMADRASADRLLLTLRADQEHEGFRALETLGSALTAAQARRIVEELAARIDGDDLAVFQLSGGTTATAKVIPRTHDDYWDNAARYAEALGWDEQVRTMHILPIIHNAGMVLAVHAAHSVGAAVVLASGVPTAEDVLPIMRDAGVTDTLAYPALTLEWRTHAEFDAAVAGLRRIVLTGMPVNDEAFDLFESRGITVLGLYGATEGLVMVTRPDAPRAVRQHCLGTPVSPYDRVRVVEPGTTTEVPDGVPGELCYLGPSTLRGYLKAPERNDEVFDSDGFFHSGDLVARRVVDGVVTYSFEGRIKDLINRGGEKISSAEIEGLITRMPGVLRAALIPIPDPRLGERGCLCIEQEPGAPRITLRDVVAYLESHEIARFKMPERVEAFEALPMTSVGKIDKKRIREDVLRRLADAAASPTQDGAAT